MNKNDIIRALKTVISKGIIDAEEFWLSNKSALVFYGIDNELEYVSINAKKNVFERLEKTNRFFERKKGKTKIMQLSPEVILYEDNRPCKYCIVDGFRIETIYSILSKKFYYGEGKDIDNIEILLQKYLAERKKSEENEDGA